MNKNDMRIALMIGVASQVLPPIKSLDDIFQS